MTTMTRVMMTALVALLSGTALFAQTPSKSGKKVDQAKLDEINRVADLLNFEDLMQAKFEEAFDAGMENNLEQSGLEGDDVMGQFIERFRERFQPGEFIEEVVAPVVDQYLTLEDLKLIGDFIESDLGNQVVSSLISGEEFDFEGEMQSGNVSEEDAMKAMQLFYRFNAKQNDFSAMGEEIGEGAQVYGQRLAMEVITDMLAEDLDGMEGGAE